jgi:hypothetical protein
VCHHEEQAQHKEMARYCLVEIKRGWPYFISLAARALRLGARSGGVFLGVAREERWLEGEVVKQN